MIDCLARCRWVQIPVVLSLSLIVSISGCGSKATGKSAPKPQIRVSGKVTIDGKPVPAGRITFINAATGNTTTAMISNGSYSTTSETGKGVNHGENAVSIIGKEKATDADGWSWTTKLDVGEKNKSDANFEIKSDATKKVVAEEAREKFD